jgi:hypothetical protein
VAAHPDDPTLIGGGPSADRAPEPAADPWIGRLVAGRFRVESFVAAGGIGRVYRARQEGLDRVVALKVLHPHLAGSEREKRRFHLEAKVASRLKHPSAVVIHDHGEWEGHLYLVMEFLEGRNLADLLEAEFPLSPERIGALLAPACEVLHEAHEAGILHRDVKPSNLFVARAPDGSERTKVVDFGLLRDLKRAPDEMGLTPADLVAGTPAYMAPEQCRGGVLDRRTDVYALGVVLYELLCDAVPFASTTGMDAMLQHLYNVPARPSARFPDLAIPAALEELALRAMAKSPSGRPDTALAFRDELLAAVADAGAPPAAPTPREQRAALPRARSARADAAGIVPLEDATRLADGVRSDVVVRVVEPPGDFDRSLTALLRARGFAVDAVATLDEARDLSWECPAFAWVVDLRPDPSGLLDALAALRDHPAAADVPRVAVGPEDSLEPMARALEAGVRDYVPESSIAARLPRVLDGILRARHRRGGGAP